MLRLFSGVWRFVISCPPGSSARGILQARKLNPVIMPSSGGSSQPREWNCISYISCIGRWVLYQWCHLGSPKVSPLAFKAKCLGPCLPGPGPLAWGVQCKVQTTCSLKRISSTVIILFEVHHPRGMGLDYMPFLPRYLSCSSFLSLVVEDLFCWSSGHSHQ